MGDEGDILTAEFYSSENKNRILNLDYDHKDLNEDDQDNIDNRDRNLSSVATAASTEPPPENIDLDD